jgi:hypothetical protein
MHAIDIEKLNQLISRTDISGNDKIKWLTDFIDSREFGQQERMYSEEDLLSAFEAGMMFIGEDKGSFKEWFEQFKKK